MQKGLQVMKVIFRALNEEFTVPLLQELYFIFAVRIV